MQAIKDVLIEWDLEANFQYGLDRAESYFISNFSMNNEDFEKNFVSFAIENFDFINDTKRGYMT